MITSNTPYVIKRDGRHEPVSYDKIQIRLKLLSDANFLPNSPALQVEPVLVAQKVIEAGVIGMSTRQLDDTAADIAAYMSTDQPDYGTLAARISVSNLHKETSADFRKVTDVLNKYMVHGRPNPMVSPDYVRVVERHGDAIQAALHYERDYMLEYFGFKTLQRSYLFKTDNNVVERPQHMYMRVALGVHIKRPSNQRATPDAPVWRPVEDFDIDAALRTYDLISRHMYTHATPTLFNSGTIRCQLGSCFLLPISDDSIVGIFDTLKDCAVISKNSGGIGLSLHNIRASGSAISGTNGTSNGIVPMIKQFNDMAKYVDQCFPAGMLVHTAGGMMSLSSLDKSHMFHDVATSDGMFKPVKTVMRYDGDGKVMAQITLMGAPSSMHVTEAHPILCVKATQAPNIALQRGLSCAEYLEASQIRSGDYLLLPVPHHDTLDALEAVPEQCELMGVCAGLTLADDALSSQWTGVLYDRCALVHAVSLVNKLFDMGYTCQIDCKKADKWVHVNLFCALPDLDMKAHWAEHVWFNILKGMIVICDPHASPLYLECRSCSVSVSTIAATALRAGLASFCTDSAVRIMWSDALCAWWRGYHWEHHPCPEMNIIVERVETATIIPLDHPVHVDMPMPIRNSSEPSKSGNLLLLPVQSVTISLPTTTPSCKQSVYDLELISEPHNYATQYGLVHNGGGRRPGAVAVYLEPWHADIYDFLMLKREGSQAHEDVYYKSRDLFYALWIPDLLMKRVFEEENGTWSLFCPNEILPTKLHELTGAEFEAAYTLLEKSSKVRRTVNAKEFWYKILESQVETGTPYMLYKDAANSKSNQRHLGVITCSNLCTEIIEYSSPDECAVCNLASLALPKFVTTDDKGVITGYDYNLFMDVVQTVVRNMNAVIDASFYPLPSMEKSNLSHRPIGLGVQGLADLFFLLRLPYGSPEARHVNRRVFKCMYYAAVSASCQLAQEHGAYESFTGRTASE